MLSSLSLHLFLSLASSGRGGEEEEGGLVEDSCRSYCFFECLQADPDQIGLVHSVALVPATLKGSICGFRMSLFNKLSSVCGLVRYGIGL